MSILESLAKPLRRNRNEWYNESVEVAYSGFVFLGQTSVNLETAGRLRHSPRKHQIDGFLFEDNMPAKGTSKAEKKEILVCRKCGASWKNKEITILVKCPSCGESKDARKRKDNRENRKYPNAQSKESKQKGRLLLRKRAFYKITKGADYKCARCGCDDIRLLEINHKYGNGYKERASNNFNAWKFLMDIATDKRSVEDLELLCRPCNAVHFLERKFGLLPIKVFWRKDNE